MTKSKKNIFYHTDIYMRRQFYACFSYYILVKIEMRRKIGLFLLRTRYSNYFSCDSIVTIVLLFRDLTVISVFFFLRIN